MAAARRMFKKSIPLEEDIPYRYEEEESQVPMMEREREERPESPKERGEAFEREMKRQMEINPIRKNKIYQPVAKEPEKENIDENQLRSYPFPPHFYYLNAYQSSYPNPNNAPGAGVGAGVSSSPVPPLPIESLNIESANIERMNLGGCEEIEDSSTLHQSSSKSNPSEEHKYKSNLTKSKIMEINKNNKKDSFLIALVDQSKEFNDPVRRGRGRGKGKGRSKKEVTYKCRERQDMLMERMEKGTPTFKGIESRTASLDGPKSPLTSNTHTTFINNSFRRTPSRNICHKRPTNNRGFEAPIVRKKRGESPQGYMQPRKRIKGESAKGVQYITLENEDQIEEMTDRDELMLEMEDSGLYERGTNEDQLVHIKKSNVPGNYRWSSTHRPGQLVKAFEEVVENYHLKHPEKYLKGNIYIYILYYIRKNIY